MPPVPLFIALADPTRCRIIEILVGGAQPVHALAAQFDISRPAISRHLRVLKQAKLITERKKGRENVYAVSTTRLRPAQQWLSSVLPTSKSNVKSPAKVAEPTPVPSTPIKPKLPLSQMGFDF